MIENSEITFGMGVVAQRPSGREWRWDAAYNGAGQKREKCMRIAVDSAEEARRNDRGGTRRGFPAPADVSEDLFDVLHRCN